MTYRLPFFPAAKHLWEPRDYLSKGVPPPTVVLARRLGILSPPQTGQSPKAEDPLHLHGTSYIGTKSTNAVMSGSLCRGRGGVLISSALKGRHIANQGV